MRSEPILPTHLPGREGFCPGGVPVSTVENIAANDERLRVLSEYWLDTLLPNHPIYREWSKRADHQTAAALVELIKFREAARALGPICNELHNARGTHTADDLKAMAARILTAFGPAVAAAGGQL